MQMRFVHGAGILACVAATAALAGDAARGPEVRVAREAGRTTYRVDLYASGRPRWARRSEFRFAALMKKHACVVYGAVDRSEKMMPLTFAAADYNGRELWRRPISMYSLAELCAGGDLLLFALDGPQWGIQLEKPANWHGVLSSFAICAFDVRRKRILWRSSTLRVGTPIWTNGKVFLTLRIDRLRRNSGPFLVYLEERDCFTRSVLLRRALPGYPAGRASANRIRPGRIRLRFGPPTNPPGLGNPWGPMLDRLDVSVPILRGSASSDAVVYRADDPPEAPG